MSQFQKKIRLIFFPFSVVYGFIVAVRNWLYDINFFKSSSFETPIIAVGNLSVGGTGKTPQIEYLIRLFSEKYKVAVLSRGYKRKTKGFILADKTSTAKTLGDEPFQYYQKFQKIQVAVDANRANGIMRLVNLDKKPNVILLDDAYQHRSVKAGFYILLTTHTDLYCNDFLLPAGNLRESSSGADRAKIVVVTKCPQNLTEGEQVLIQKKLNLKPNQSLYFSYIDYDNAAIGQKKNIQIDEIQQTNKLIIVGIAKPKPFIEFVKKDGDDVIIYKDHHHFSDKDLQEIDKKSQNKIIITTEKDYVRLQDTFLKNKLFYLPMQSKFISKEKQFQEEIIRFISH